MIDAYSWPTPNGHKIHIMLEECGLPYRAIGVDIGAGDQFKPEFLAISPNNKIPAIVDADGPDGKPISLFESGAILVYLAGKTGTTSDAVDGWFAGYASNIVAVAWMGYDDPKSLGGREFGATLALPIWIDSMRIALAGKPEVVRATPENLVSVDGKWSYAEYQTEGGKGVKALDIEDSLGDRLLKLFKP